MIKKLFERIKEAIEYRIEIEQYWLATFLIVLALVAVGGFVSFVFTLILNIFGGFIYLTFFLILLVWYIHKEIKQYANRNFIDDDDDDPTFIG